MIRSSTITLNWVNLSKKELLKGFLRDYRSVVQSFVDLLWDMEKFPSLLPKETTTLVDPLSLSARALQAAGKQAGAIVKGSKAKHNRRLYVLGKLKEQGDQKGIRRLEKAIACNPVGKPDISSVCPELDSRFCKIDTDPSNSFELWVTLSSLGKPYGKISLPFQRNKHFNKLFSKGALKGGVRLSPKGITFMFELPDPITRKDGKTLGIDIGQKKVLSVSTGFQTPPNKHGHDLVTITKVLCRKKRGSKAFLRAQTHRDNYINWSINQLNLDGVSTIVRENIKDIGRGRNFGRSLSHWTYPTIIDKLESRCAELGVLVKTVEPTYTSQRCHRCGYTRKSNRKGQAFKCRICGYTADADLNAALNISLCLPPSGVDRRDKLNRTGFYWLSSGQEPVVPVVKQP